MKKTQLSFDAWWTNKQNVAYMYNGILNFSVLKRKESLIHATEWMNFENIVKWNKTDTKGQILSDSTYMRYLE